MFGASYTLGLDPKGFGSGISSAAGMLAGFTSQIGAVPFLAFKTGFGLLGKAVDFFTESISKAAGKEDMVTNFKVLLGSMGAARQRMKELSEFAASTPFKVGEVAEANKQLQTLTSGALSGIGSMRMIGDVAAFTGQSFGETAQHIGLMYSEIQSGSQELGFAMREMVHTGVISAETRKKIDELQAAGQHSAAWATLTSALGRFSGTMEEKSHGWSNLMEKLQGKISAVYTAFGMPLISALKPILEEVVGLAAKLPPLAAEWGAKIGNAVNTMRIMWQQGTLGESAGLALKIGFGDAVGFLTEKMMKLVGWLQSSGAVTGLFTGLATVFEGISMQISAAITKGIVSAASGIKILGKSIMGGDVAAEKMAGANLQSSIGGHAVSSGLAMLQQLGGVASQAAGFIKGLGEDAGKAKVLFGVNQFAAHSQAGSDAYLQAYVDALHGSGNSPGAMTSEKAPEDVIGKGKSEALSDRLSKIGLFIGGNGGPKGERYQQQTAENSKTLVQYGASSVEYLAEIASKFGTSQAVF